MAATGHRFRLPRPRPEPTRLGSGRTPATTYFLRVWGVTWAARRTSAARALSACTDGQYHWCAALGTEVGLAGPRPRVERTRGRRGEPPRGPLTLPPQAASGEDPWPRRPASSSQAEEQCRRAHFWVLVAPGRDTTARPRCVEQRAAATRAPRSARVYA